MRAQWHQNRSAARRPVHANADGWRRASPNMHIYLGTCYARQYLVRVAIGSLSFARWVRAMLVAGCNPIGLRTNHEISLGHNQPQFVGLPAISDKHLSPCTHCSDPAEKEH